MHAESIPRMLANGQRRCCALAGALALVFACTEASASVIDIHGITAMGAAEARSSSFGMYVGELRWGWIGPQPAGYSPGLYTYAAGLLQYVTDVQTMPTRSTDLLVVPGLAFVGSSSVWSVNTYTPTVGSASRAVDEAALQVAIWDALYDPARNPDQRIQVLTTGAVAMKSVQYLSALYAGPPVYSAATATWVDAADARPRNAVAARPSPAPALLALRRRRSAGYA